jgi:hypothetical protein
MAMNPARRKRKKLAKAVVPLALGNSDAERTVSDGSADGDAPGEMEVGSLGDVIDGVAVGQDSQPEEDLLAEAIKEVVMHLREIKKLTGAPHRGGGRWRAPPGEPL